jgi:two-component SAPR family response regulator
MPSILEQICQKFGKSLECIDMRIYLMGQVCIEADSRLVDERQFPGKQGRLVFAYLVCERLRPVTRDELAEAVWPGTFRVVLRDQAYNTVSPFADGTSDPRHLIEGHPPNLN